MQEPYWAMPQSERKGSQSEIAGFLRCIRVRGGGLAKQMGYGNNAAG